MKEIEKKFSGVLELDIEETQHGETVYIVSLVNSENKKLYNQFEEFIDKKVIISIKEIT